MSFKLSFIVLVLFLKTTMEPIPWQPHSAPHQEQSTLMLNGISFGNMYAMGPWY